MKHINIADVLKAEDEYKMYRKQRKWAESRDDADVDTLIALINLELLHAREYKDVLKQAKSDRVLIA